MWDLAGSNELLAVHTVPFESRPIGPKLNQPLMLDFSHIDSPAVRSAKTQITGSRAQHIDLTQDFAGWGEHGDGAFTVPCDVEVSVHVAPHAVKAVVGKLFQQSLIGQITCISDAEGPHVALHTLIDVQSFSVGADIDTVGRTHVGSNSAG